MKLLTYPILILVFISCNNTNQTTTMEEKFLPPTCKKTPKKLTIHSDLRIDNYYWLKERENKDVINYLNEENKYTNAILKETEKTQDSLYTEMRNRIKEDDQSVPYFFNGFYYSTKYDKGSEHPIHTRKTTFEGNNEEVLLDGNKMAKGYDYFDLGGFEISKNNKIIAYSYDTLSRRMYNLQFKNLETGKLYPEIIKNTNGSMEWANDNKTVFYTQQDPVTLRSNKIFKHILGTDPKNDELVFEEKDETFDCGINKTKSQKYLMITSSSTLTDEVQYIPTDNPNEKPIVFQKRTRGLEYRVYHFEDKFYIQTNLEAQNFCLMECNEKQTSSENWKIVIPNRNETLIEYIEIFKNNILICERTDGLVNFRIINTENKNEHYVDFPEDTYVAYTSANFQFETNKLRFWYNSLLTPGTTYEYNMDTKERSILKQREIIGDFKSENYSCSRLWATARDGVKIPISIVHRKDILLDGNNPLLQYAYGSYGYSMDPNFSSNRLSLLDRGFIFAIAHIRGGEEMGRSWYEDGKLLKKKNTFTDFIDCSEFLIEKGYTNSNQLYGMGGSAGGLLMGAVFNMRPELYNGLIAAVPFVDVVTTMLDEDIPLTTSEYDEWGNPNDSIYYNYMLSYSPYDNVEAKDYTNLLVTTGLHDSQVQYWEPAKWVAKLRELKTDDNLVLLKTNMNAGHGGSSGRFEYLKEIALDYAFILMLEQNN
ncbi:MAG: S9 family peptidase [Flavobacteriales bacterium]|nr:S9 family peptidase [Flavobacteriales bacterium]